MSLPHHTDPLARTHLLALADDAAHEVAAALAFSNDLDEARRWTRAWDTLMNAAVETPPDINSPTGECDRCGSIEYEEHLMHRGRIPAVIWLCEDCDDRLERAS